MYIKLVSILLVVLLLGGIFASVSFGVNQIVILQERAQVRSAEAQCVKYDAPHAIIEDGVVFCYRMLDGSERALPLEKLQQWDTDGSTGG